MTSATLSGEPTTLTAVTVSDGATEHASRRAILAWAGFAMLFLYAVLLGGSWVGIYVLTLRLWSLGIIAVALAGWAIVAWRRPEWRPGSSAWPLVVLPLGAFALAVAASRYPRLGLEYLAYAVLLAALYLLLVRVLATPFARARIGALAATLGLVTGIVYLAMVTLAWIDWWGLVGGLRDPAAAPALRGTDLRQPERGADGGRPPHGHRLRRPRLPGSRPAAHARRADGDRGHRSSSSTGSRAGWIALAAALRAGGRSVARRRRAVGTPRTSPSGPPRGRRARGDRGRRSWSRAVLIGPSVYSRVMGAGDGGRTVYFATAVRMFEEAPLLGTGPGTWAVQREAYTQPGRARLVRHARAQRLPADARRDRHRGSPGRAGGAGRHRVADLGRDPRSRPGGAPLGVGDGVHARAPRHPVPLRHVREHARRPPARRRSHRVARRDERPTHRRAGHQRARSIPPGPRRGRRLFVLSAVAVVTLARTESIVGALRADDDPRRRRSVGGGRPWRSQRSSPTTRTCLPTR